jgi:hypothetical protein
MMLHYSYIDGCMDLYETCQKCTKLGIDVYGPELYSDVAAKSYLRPESGWTSIPFPSDFHMSSEVTEPLWAFRDGVGVGVDIGIGEEETYAQRRNILLAYVGSDQVTASKQRLLRIAIRKHCQRLRAKEIARGEKKGLHTCLFTSLDTHESHALLPPALRSSINITLDIQWTAPPENLYERARMCLMPGGDFPTRKGFFDALLSGCVPVIFQPASALTQWPWHWSNNGSGNLAKSCVIYFPGNEFMKNVPAAMESLARMAANLTLLKQKRQCIASIAMQMQYNAPGKEPIPLSRLKQWGAHSQNDAIDVVLHRLLK